MNEPFRRSRVTDQLVERLTREIVSGRTAPGRVLPSEPELVGKFGISKVAVREAIGVLAALGLVDVQQGKRTVVRDQQEWYVLSPVVQRALRTEFGPAQILDQLFEARLILEPAAAALAAGRVTDGAVVELERLMSSMRRVASDSADLQGFLRIDRDFHDAVARLVDNPPVRSMTRDLHRHMLDNWADSMVTAEDLPRLVDEHEAIAQALAARDGRRAREAMERHILRAREVEVGRRLQRPAAPQTGRSP